MSKRTMVVGDVHGCSRELSKLLKKADYPKRVVLVGDLYTRGPDPAGVWDLIREHNIESVLGNHDDRLVRAVQRGDLSDPFLKACIRTLNKHDADWLGWLASRPLFLSASPFTVVHASLHTSGRLDKTTREMALFWRRWPKNDPKSKFWHETYKAKRPVIFGHDAARKLIHKKRKGKTHLVGLDTGCVYGGELTGYLVEEDRFVHKTAKKMYFPISK